MSDQLHYVHGGRELDPEVKVSMVECGSCDDYHREDFWGDCRNDSQRFMPHDRSDGEPEYICADGKEWISEAEYIGRQETLFMENYTRERIEREKEKWS